MAKAHYIQVGVTALRSPTGDFLPSVPIYIKTNEAIKASGLTEGEENAVQAISELFAIKNFEQQEENIKCQS